MSKTKIKPLPKVAGGFGVILCDPPWSYSNKTTRAAADHNYATLTAFELQTLPVSDVAAKNCALLMWSTCPMVPDALALGKSWGFEYKTIAFWWAKVNTVSTTPFFGMGNYTRANGEPCLLFTRGRPKRANAAISQFVWERIRRHSEKPTVVHKRIELLFGKQRRLEMFSRAKVNGWRGWGNELLP
jgi:N6-adenosine-specific RNA methylase IME4